MKNTLLKILKWGIIFAIGFIILLNIGIFLVTEIFLSCRFQAWVHGGPLPENFKCTNSGIMGSVKKDPIVKVDDEIICPVGMGTIYATGTKIAISCYEFEKPLTENTISSEVDYTPQKNNINLSLEESEQIVKNLIKKQEEDLKKEENTGSLIQGDWKAVYIPPKYPDGFDSILVTMSGKTYTFPGVYGKNERTRYLERIGSGTGCVSYVQGPNPEQGTENVLINGKYYYPPNHGDCMSGVRTFRNFDGFSPSGYYLIYHVSGWEWAEVIIFDIQAGKNILENSNNDSRTLISWTPDGKRMLYYTEGWDNEKPSGVYITRTGNFPIGDKVVTPGPGGLRYMYADDKYIYMLEEYTDYYLRIFDISTFDEVYSRIVKK